MSNSLKIFSFKNGVLINFSYLYYLNFFISKNVLRIFRKRFILKKFKYFFIVYINVYINFFYYIKLFKFYLINYNNYKNIIYNSYFYLKMYFPFINEVCSINYNFGFFLKSKDIKNLQLLLFQSHKVICNITFLLNNTIGSLVDIENGFTFFIQSTSMLGFRSSSSKSRYAISVLLENCFSKLVSFGLNKLIVFKLTFNSFVDVKYLLSIIYQMILYNFGKRYLFTNKGFYISKKGKKIRKIRKVKSNFFYSKNAEFLYNKFKGSSFFFFFRKHHRFLKDWVKLSFFSKYLYKDLLSYLNIYLKNLDFIINENTFFNNLYLLFNHDIYSFFNFFINKKFLNIFSFLNFIKFYSIFYIHFKNDLNILKVLFSIIKSFLKKRDSNFIAQIKDMYGLLRKPLKFSIYKLSHKFNYKMHIYLKKENVFSKYFFKLKIIYVVKSFAFNGCRYSKLRRKRKYYHRYLRTHKSSLSKYLLKKQLLFQGI